MFSYYITIYTLKAFHDLIKHINLLYFMICMCILLLWRKVIAFIGFSKGSVTHKKVTNHCYNLLPLFFQVKNRGAKRMDKFLRTQN